MRKRRDTFRPLSSITGPSSGKSGDTLLNSRRATDLAPTRWACQDRSLPVGQGRPGGPVAVWIGSPLAFGASAHTPRQCPPTPANLLALRALRSFVVNTPAAGTKPRRHGGMEKRICVHRRNLWLDSWWTGTSGTEPGRYTSRRLGGCLNPPIPANLPQNKNLSVPLCLCGEYLAMGDACAPFACPQLALRYSPFTTLPQLCALSASLASWRFTKRLNNQGAQMGGAQT